jgi:hypothetical protein
MLYWQRFPPKPGVALDISGTGPLAPPDFATDADEHRGYLRSRYRDSPAPFVRLAHGALTEDYALMARERDDLARALYEAVVAVAERRGWRIAGGERL